MRLIITALTIMLLTGCAAYPDIEYSKDTHHRLMVHHVSGLRFVDDADMTAPVQVSFAVASGGHIVSATYDGANPDDVRTAAAALAQAMPLPRHTRNEPIRYNVEVEPQ